MAEGSPSTIRKVPGTLISTPTDLSGSSPYGGTSLGTVRDMEFRHGMKTANITAEEWGGQAVESIYTGEACVLACVFRGWDVDAITALFPTATTGASGEPLILFQPGKSDTVTVRPGRKLGGRGIKLLFAPESPDYHQFVVLYNAIPMSEPSQVLQLMIGREAGTAAVFVGLPDSAGRVHAIGKREDISL